MASAVMNINGQLATHRRIRAKVIASEKQQRHDHAFRQRLSPTALRAAEIVRRIRAHEAATVWTSATVDAERDVYPGMMFTLAKTRMERTELWRIVKRMPKGCLLHAHLEAMVDTEWLFGVALATDGMCICSDSPLVTARDLETADIRFTFSADCGNTGDAGGLLYTPEYSPGTLVPICAAADAFPAHLLPLVGPSSPREGFLRWITSRTTITAEESLRHHEGINRIWAKFQSIFAVIQGVIYYEPIYRRFIQHVLHSLHQDGILWVDLRLAFVMTFKAAHTGAELPRLSVVKAFAEEVASYKASAAGSGFWGARMIWTSIRQFDSDAIVASMKECVAAKKHYPDVIAGFDLVGQEDIGRTHLEMLPELLWFQSYCTQEDVSIPFFFHAGETLGDGSPADENLFDAVLLGTKRIGHGFSLHKHPLLMELVRERGICVEVCPISNEILRLASSILSHSLPALLAHGVAVSLSNDDPGILGQKATSMTHDYWQVLQAFDNVGLEGLGDLAETSVMYAAFEGGEVGMLKGPRVNRLAMWRGLWEGFCQWIVEEYSSQWEHPN